MAGLVRLDSGRLLDEMLGGGASFPAVRGGGFSSLRPMLVDVAERPDCFEMLVDIPGIPKEHISLVVEGQTVTISATPTPEEAAKEAGDSGAGVTWHRIERSTMYASRGACCGHGYWLPACDRLVHLRWAIPSAALRFPENANMHDIQAHADDGVLRLRIAKTAEAKRDKTVVKVT
jgi:HSP20 family molecular chaperone IbpA